MQESPSEVIHKQQQRIQQLEQIVQDQALTITSLKKKLKENAHRRSSFHLNPHSEV